MAEVDYARPARRRKRADFSGLKFRLIIAAGIVLFSLLGYLGSSQTNPITGEKQRVGGMTTDKEIQMGLHSMPALVHQFDGQSPDQNAQRFLDYVGARLVNALQQRLASKGKSNPYPIEFHLLADRETVNAFALPGGQVFVTEALFWKLAEGNVSQDMFESRIAGVLGHEIGHVIERHGAQRMAKSKFFSRLAQSAGVASGDVSGTQLAGMVSSVVLKGNSRNHELESDRWGVELMVYAGYDPRSLNDVMDVLEAASGGNAPPEILSTHPKPANRRAYIRQIIEEKFPAGIPPGLKR